MMNKKAVPSIKLASVATLVVGCSVATEETTTTSQAVVTDCSSLQSWVGNDWRLSFDAGEIIEHDGERYQANQSIHYPNKECAPDSPVAWCSSWFTHLGACGDEGGGTPPDATCNDGIQNQGEAGVDCGGPCEACQVDPTCSDGVQNQGEAGIDCGGPCEACDADGPISSQPGDCKFTSQCKQMYDGATDCKNNLGGICYCGNEVCTTGGDSGGGTGGSSSGTGGSNGGGGGGTMLGQFEIGVDLLLCNYDQKPDEDDIHAVAGLATLLRDSRFAGVDYHCTAGAYGKQGGTFINEPGLFNLAFGSQWANADSNWNGAVDAAFNRARTVLSAGGDIWVTEAGQSDFTADVVRKIRSELPNIDTGSRIHVVQHSDWNENQTTASDLSYVKSNTDYHKIDDGNSSNNSTPGLNTKDGSQWGRAKSDPQVGAIWTEAEVAAKRWFGVNWDNENIKAGGMDFSDTVEPMWIFGFGGLNGGVKGFFDEFL